MLSGDQSLRLDTWNLIGTSGSVLDSPCTVIDSSSTPCQGNPYSWNQSATGETPVRESTGKFVAKSEESNRETIPTPRFLRRSPTMGSFFPAEGIHPQNYMADQSRLQISELQFGKFSTPSTFACWKISFKTQVSSCSGSLSEALLWVQERGDGRFSGRLKIILLNSGLRSFPEF